MTSGRGVAALLLVATVAGCGNAVDVGPGAGATALVVDDAGHLSVVTEVCRDEVDTIEIVRDREGLSETEDNPLVARYRSADPQTGRVTLSLDEPGPGWRPGTPTRLERGTGYIVTASGSGEDGNEAAPVYVSGDALSTMTPGGFYAGYEEDGSLTRHSDAEFRKLAERACAD